MQPFEVVLITLLAIPLIISLWGIVFLVLRDIWKGEFK